MKKTILFAIITFFFINILSAKEGYEIKLKVNPLKNSKCLLAWHFGDKKYIRDSGVINDKSIVTFKGKEQLKGGIYLLVLPEMGNRYFEFMVSGTEPEIFLETDTTDFVGKMKVHVSDENKVFYDDVLYVNSKRIPSEALSDKIKISVGEEKENYIKQLRAVENEVKAYRINIINTKPNYLYSKILGCMREVEVPDAPKDASGKIIDSNFQYNYYKNHYFDYTDFNDDRILRTPVFEPKLKNYFDKILIKHPDTLIKETDKILSKLDPKSDMFQFCVVTQLNFFGQSQIMGLDAGYVHMVDKYYAAGKAHWTDSAQLKEIIKRGAALKPLLIGKVAPNIDAFDTTFAKVYSLYNTTSDYTVIYFWNPTCGHCKTETPKLVKIYDELKKRSVEVFGVTTANYEEINEWKKFSIDNKLNFINVGDPYFKFRPHFRDNYDITSTPVVYVIDKTKKIIAKRIGIDQLIDFVDNYKKYQGKM